MSLASKLLGFALVGTMLSGSAYAQQIGVVDMQEISTKYYKAQSLATDVRGKETELAKLRDSLATQLKNGSKLSPVEKKNLEDKLNTQFASKFKEYRDYTTTQEAAIKSDFDRAIKQVTTEQKLDLVLPKQAVLEGGRDVTANVLTILNK